MKKTPAASSTGNEVAKQALRGQAEARLAQSPDIPESLSPDEIREMLHELRVHQIELEMQNEELRRAQAEIEAGRARYFDLYDLAPVGYCTLSGPGLILEANLTAATLLGTARGDLVRRPLSRFILKEDQDIYYLHRRKLMASGDPQECELRLIKPDGASFWVQLTATAAQAEDGTPVCRLVLSDITMRRQSAVALLEREEQLRSIAANIPGAIYQFVRRSDGMFEIPFISEGARLLCGRPVTELQEASRLFDDVHPEDVPGLWASIEASAKDMAPWNAEFRIVPKMAPLRWLRGTSVPVLTPEGDTCWNGVLLNITEQKRGDELARMQHTLALALAAASDLQQGLRLCLQTALQGAGLDAGGFYLVDENSGALELWVPQGLSADFVEAASRFEASSDQTRLIMAGLPVYAGFENLSLNLSEAERREGLRFIAVIPLHHEGRVIGCMNASSHALHDLPPANRQVLETIAATATQAIVRLRAKERLRASETLLNETQRLSKVGGWEWDLIRQTMVWTAEMYRLHDLSAGDVAPGSDEHIRRSAACYGPEHQAAILEAFHACVERGEAYDLDVPFTSAKGRSMWVRTTAQAVWEGNRIVKVVGNLMDITGRKQAEESLGELQRQFQSTLDGLSAHIALLNDCGEIIFTNKAYRNFAEENEINPSIVSEGVNYLAVCDSTQGEERESAALFAQGIREVLSGKRPAFEFEYPCHSPGEQRWFIGRVTPVQDQDGRRVVVAHENITGRKQAELAQRETSLRLQESVRAANVGLWDWDLATNCVHYSSEWKRQIGYDDDEIAAAFEEWERRVHPEDLAPTLEKVREAITGDSLRYQAEFRFRHKDGSYRWIVAQCSVLRAENGKAVRVVGSHLDLTEFKTVEEALRESEAHLRLLFENLPSGIVVHAADTAVLFANPEASRLLGLTLEQMQGKTATDPAWCFLCEDGGALPLEDYPVNRLRTSGKSFAGQIIGIRLPGRSEPNWVQCSAYPQRDASGQISQVIVAFTDITERKQAEARQKESQKLLNATFQAVDSMLAVIDKEYRVHLCNWKDHEWVPREERITSPSCYKVMKNLDSPCEGCPPMDTFKDGKPRCYEDRNPIDGSYKEVSVLPIFNDHGEVEYVLENVRDITGRKRAEEALRQSEERNRLLSDLTMEGILLHRNAVAIDLNLALARMMGFERDELLARNFLEFMHVDDRSLVLENIAKEYAAPYTVRMVRSTGEPFFAEIESHNFQQQGDLLRVSAIRDITERKRAEEALRRSEALLNASQRLARIGGWSWDLASQSMSWTDETYHLHDLNPGDIPAGSDEHATRSLECYDECDRPTVLATFLRCLEQGEPYDLEVPFTTVKGRRLWIRTSAQAVTKDGKVQRVTGLIMDITERKREQEAIRESEAKFRTLVEASSSGIWRTDAAGYNTYVSPRWCEIAGMPAAAAAGQGWAAGLHPDDRIPTRTGWEAAATASLPYSAEFRFVHPGGRIVWVLCQASPVMAGDHVVEWIGTISDITEIKRAEAEREALQAKLIQVQKMESVGRLAGGVAHDFNNMLGVIIGHTEFAMEKAPPASPLYADLVQIHDAAQRSAGLTRQLLAFARKQTVAPKVLDLNATIGSMLNLLRRLIGENIDLLWKPGPDLWPIKMDPTQIEQILTNLCVNSRDAIADVGQVTVETGNIVFDSDCRGAQVGVVPGEYVMLAASDNGCGMDSGTLPHLFEPFFTTKEEGTGLGLAIVHGAVKQNHGFIEVHSEPGEGTTVKVYLPRHAAGAAVAETKQPGLPSAEHARGTILLVEDEPMLLFLGRTVLERLGYTVLAAATPGEAIRMTRERAHCIDLVMTDVVMPEMNGLDLSKALLSINPDLRLLFMSGYTADVIARRGVLDEGAHFIQKPFSIANLESKLLEILQS